MPDLPLSVLLVDDDEQFRDTLKLLLRTGGVESVTATGSVEDALDNLDLFRYEFIISDFNMEPMNGLDLLRIVRTRKTYDGTPFLMITADLSNEVWLAAIQAGATEFLRKPFTRVQLMASICVAMGGDADLFPVDVRLADGRSRTRA